MRSEKGELPTHWLTTSNQEMLAHLKMVATVITFSKVKILAATVNSFSKCIKEYKAGESCRFCHVNQVYQDIVRFPDPLADGSGFFKVRRRPCLIKTGSSCNNKCKMPEPFHLFTYVLERLHWNNAEADDENIRSKTKEGLKYFMRYPAPPPTHTHTKKYNFRFGQEFSLYSANFNEIWIFTPIDN